MKMTVNYTNAHDALSIIHSGNRVFVHGSAQTPSYLLKELAKGASRLKDVELIFISVYGEIEVDKPQYANNFRINSLFVSASVRNSVSEGRADYVPVFLSDIPNLFSQDILPVDVALVQVSPPDKHGYCSLGLSVDIAHRERLLYNVARYVCFFHLLPDLKRWQKVQV